MSTGPLNKTGLGEAVALELGVSKQQGHRAVAAVLDVIARTVAAGHSVTVTNFGTWTPRYVPERKLAAREAPVSLATRARTVPAHHKLRFTVSPRLRAAVKAQDPAAATIRKRPQS